MKGNMYTYASGSFCKSGRDAYFQVIEGSDFGLTADALLALIQYQGSLSEHSTKKGPSFADLVDCNQTIDAARVALQDS